MINVLLQLSEVLPVGGIVTAAKRTSKSDAELVLLDKLVTTLLERNAEASSSPSSSQNSSAKGLRPLSRALSRSFRMGSMKRNNNSALPTIAESGASGRRSDLTLNPGVRNVLSSIRNAPQRFSTANDSEENKNLTTNILEWRQSYAQCYEIKAQKHISLISAKRKSFIFNKRERGRKK